MKTYYVNKKMGSDHEVHEDGCSHMPSPENKEYLGFFVDCTDAVRKAKEIYGNADGCAYCSYKCHTK